MKEIGDGVRMHAYAIPLPCAGGIGGVGRDKLV